MIEDSKEDYDRNKESEKNNDYDRFAVSKLVVAIAVVAPTISR